MTQDIYNISNENTTDKAHSIFPPSSASRHLNCTPSLVMESMFPDKSGEAAEEGTAAHALAEYKARAAFGYEPEGEYPTSAWDGEEMEDGTDIYVNFLKMAASNLKDPIVLLERVVHFDKFIPGGFGTADCIMLSDDAMHIIDFKYGRNCVEAEDNDQMKTYAVGALQDFGAGYPNIKTIYVSIVQPRISNYPTWSLSADELRDWSNKVLRPKGQMALAGAGDLCEGSWCKYCKAKSFCSLKNTSVINSVSQINLEKKGLMMSHDEVAHLIPVAEEIASWSKSLLDYAKSSAIEDGVHWEGYKLVEGKKNRFFADKDAVIERGKNLMIEPEALYTKPELVSVAQLEKNVGKKNFKEHFSDLVSYKSNNPSFVPIDDPREEYIPTPKEQPKTA